MKLILGRDNDEIRKYAHVQRDKSVPGVCFEQLPGGIARCILHTGHSGPHIARAGFWIFKATPAVWDDNRETDE